MQVQINGDRRELPAGSTVAGMLAELQLNPRFLAVEVNRRLVPRAEHARTVLHPQDEVEIVTLVGGG